jgi:hypothetical protein
LKELDVCSKEREMESPFNVTVSGAFVNPESGRVYQRIDNFWTGQTPVAHHMVIGSVEEVESFLPSDTPGLSEWKTKHRGPDDAGFGFQWLIGGQ